VAEPVANDDSYTVGENRYIKPLAITGILANDLRNGQYPPQTIVLDPPTSGQLILAPDGAFTYRPNLHFTGDDAFQYALLEVPPIAISFLADDPEYPDELYSAGDTLTVSFDRPTNTPGGDEPHTRMTVDSLFSFSEFNIGSDYQGSWKNASVYTIEVIDPTGAHAKLGAISATPAGILPIRNASGNSAGASVPSPVLKGSFSITRMTWTNRINVAEDGVRLSSTTAANGFIAGASSNERIIYPASAPHFVQWVVDGTNQHVMAGLNDVDTQTHFSEIDFAAYTERENGRFKVWESGIEKGSFGTYDAGDTIRIETDGSQVYYLVNGSLRYTSTRILSASDFPFILDVAFNSYEASISEAVTNSAQASITWTNQMNVAVKGVTLCSTTATNGFVSGASSKEEILYPTNFPHFVQWVVDSTNQHVIAGLNDLDTQTHFSEIDFAVHTERNTGHFKIRELGVEKGTFGSYSAGDTIRIETECTQVHYLVNDEQRYTTTRTLSENVFPFVFDVAFISENASLSNAKTNSFQFTPSDLLPIPTGSAPNSDTGTFFYDTAVVSISVQATNILVGESEYYQLLRNDTLTVTAANGVLANDLATDGLLSARIESEPSHGSLNLFPDGGFHFVAEGGFTGFDHFVYIPFDSAGDGAPVIVAIRIGNQPPVANDDDFDMDEDSTLIRSGVRGLLINDTDPDFDALTAASVTTPLHGQLTLAVDGAFTYQPAPDFLGTDSFFYRVNDDFANSANATVLIRVANANDIPVSLPESYTTLEDTLLLRSKDLGVLANDTDADNEALRSELITDVTHGNLTLATDGAFTYSPNPTYAGTDSFQYRARDAVAASAVLTVGITVHAVNDPPVAANDSYSVAEQERLIVSVGDGLLTNDDDPEGSTLIALLQAPLFDGDLSLSTNGAFTFLPAPGFSGLTSFGYRAYDETAESLLATVYIDVNSPPTIALVGDVEERVPIGFPYHDAGAIATDFGDGIISKSIVISGVVDTDTIGSYTLRYDVSDSGGLDATAAFRIVTVTNDGVSQTIPLDSGWNLISLPGRSQLQLSQMISADGAALTFFSQNGGLFERLAPQEKLTPGKGYWTFASRPCQLTVVHDVPIPVLLSLPGKAFSLIGPVNLNPWPGPEVPRTLMCWDSRFRTLPPTADLKPFRGYIIYLETGGQFTLR
jgi:VCBS repeat-containing protein